MTNKDAIILNINELDEVDKEFMELAFDTKEMEFDKSVTPHIPTAIIVEGIDGVGKTTFIDELRTEYETTNIHNSETTIETFAKNITELNRFHLLSNMIPSLTGYPYRKLLYAIDRWYLSGFIYNNSGLDVRWNNIFQAIPDRDQFKCFNNLHKYVDEYVNLKLYIEPCWNCYEISDKTRNKLKDNVAFTLYKSKEEGYLYRLKRLNEDYKHHIRLLNKQLNSIPYLIVNRHDLIFAKVIIKGMLINIDFNSDIIIEMNKKFQETEDRSSSIMSCEKLLNLYGKSLRGK